MGAMPAPANEGAETVENIEPCKPSAKQASTKRSTRNGSQHIGSAPTRAEFAKIVEAVIATGLEMGLPIRVSTPADVRGTWVFYPEIENVGLSPLVELLPMTADSEVKE